MSAYTIVGDWGTSRLRLFRIVNGEVSDRMEEAGISVLTSSPEEALRNALAPWRRTHGNPQRITLCGMVGSRNGWIEVPYVDCPSDVGSWLAASVRISFDDCVVTIMAGLAGTTASKSPDVMRGEETQLFGAMALRPSLASGRHVVVLPGTHSKWAWIEDGRIIRFQTFLTGEMFALLRDHSMLTRTSASALANIDEEGFEHGLTRAQGGQILGALFEARSAQLRQGRSAEWALGYISGLLLGREVAEASTGDRVDQIVLIGDPGLTSRYQRALQVQTLTATVLDGDACVLAGLKLLENFK